MSSTKMAHHKLKPHSEQCGLACKLKFSSSLDLAYHYLVGHHSPDLVKGDGFLHCSKCFEVFKPCQKSVLENHEKYGKHLVCSRDNRAFSKSKESAYKYHISQKHTLKCNRCELSFLPADRLFLEKHKKEAHMGEGDGDHLVDDFEEKEEGSKRRSRMHEAQVERLETIPVKEEVKVKRERGEYKTEQMGVDCGHDLADNAKLPHKYKCSKCDRKYLLESDLFWHESHRHQRETAKSKPSDKISREPEKFFKKEDEVDIDDGPAGTLSMAGSAEASSTVDGAAALEKAFGENPVPADKGASGDGEQENICWLCCAAEPAVELRVCKGCNRVGRVHCAG